MACDPSTSIKIDHTYTDIIPKDFKCTKGDEIHLRLIDGSEYTAKFHSQNVDTGRLKVYDAMYLDDDIKFESYYFDHDELKEVTVNSLPIKQHVKEELQPDIDHLKNMACNPLKSKKVDCTYKDVIPNDLKCAKGDNMYLRLIDGGEYTAKFHSQNSETGRLKVYDVVYLNDNTKFESFYYFHRTELREITVTSLLTKQLVEEEPQFDIDRIKNMVKYYIMITEMNSEFQDALEYLETCDILGVDGKNCEFGKNAKLSYLVITAWDQTYVFDVKTLGEKMFESKLKHILQSNYITKIVFNHEKLFECLSYQHQVCLRNFYDLCNIDKYICENSCDETDLCTFDLNSYIKKYMKVSCDLVDTKSRIGRWTKKPLSDVLKNILPEYSVYLIPLYTEMDKGMNRLLYDAMDIHLASIRDLDPGSSYYVCTTNQMPHLEKFFSDGSDVSK